MGKFQAQKDFPCRVDETFRYCISGLERVGFGIKKSYIDTGEIEALYPPLNLFGIDWTLGMGLKAHIMPLEGGHSTVMVEAWRIRFLNPTLGELLQPGPEKLVTDFFATVEFIIERRKQAR